MDHTEAAVTPAEAEAGTKGPLAEATEVAGVAAE